MQNMEQERFKEVVREVPFAILETFNLITYSIWLDSCSIRVELCLSQDLAD